MAIESNESEDEKRDRRNNRPESCPEWHVSDPPIDPACDRPFTALSDPTLTNTFHDFLQLNAKPQLPFGPKRVRIEFRQPETARKKKSDSFHGFFDFFSLAKLTGDFNINPEGDPMPITLNPIGTVRNTITEPTDTGWGRVESTIVLEEQWTGAFDGLQQFSHALVLSYLHRVAERHTDIPAKRHPRNRDDMPLLGVFAQRARVRPNPIGVTACAIVRVDARELLVRGLDAIDGTPIIDVKPYVPIFDRIEAPRVPEWVDVLLGDYR